MREFSNNISESLINGIKRNSRIRRSENFLEEGKNVKCKSYGMTFLDTPTDPFDSGISVSYPYPQIFRGKGYTLLCYADQIDVVDTSTDPWTTSTLSLINLDGTSGSITGTGMWHFLDLNDSWYLFNGVDVVFIDPVQVFQDETITAYVDRNVTIKSGCYNRGRAFIGGLGSDIWSNGMNDIFNSIEDDIEDPVPLRNEGIGGNTVMWSSIGAHDFPHWLYFPERAMYGNIDDFKLLTDAIFRRTALFETLNRNEFGFMEMPFQGDVVCVKPLGQHTIVYGEDGIVALTPTVSRDNQVSTMQMTELTSFGIPARGHVGGELRSHVFINGKGEMFSLTADLNINSLGYDHLFSGLSNIRISFDSQETEFHISSDTDCYILTSSGMTEERYRLTSGFVLSGDFNGVYETDADGNVLIVTSPYDFGLRAIKTINSIQFGSTYNGNMDVAVDYRYKDSDSFTRTSFVPINNETGAFIRISAVDFRFVIRCDNMSGFEIDYIQVKWQASDKRQIRGTYVSPTST